MTAERDWQALARRLAQRARELVDCQAAGLLLGCPDESVRHPLLDVFVPVSASYLACYGCSQETLRALLRYEQVRALLDIAAQRGRVHWCEAGPALRGALAIGSVAVAPLERPAGILGSLLLFDERPGAFTAGECRLLTALLSRLARELEQQLRRLSLARRSPAEEAGPSPEGRHYRLAPPSELDQLKYEFISMVSHELRTPLTAIKGYASLLQAYGPASQGRKGSDGLTEELQRHYLEVILEQVNHLEALAGDLLDVSRIHANHLALRCSPLDIAPLCQRCVELIRQRVEREAPGKYVFRCRFVEPLPPVWADADRVQQVLTNLLENAVKYSPAGGVITIEAGLLHGQQADGKAMLQVSVCDQGIGIAPEQQARLFRPFSRLEQQSCGCVPGVGLGLYITRRLVEAMGGRIQLRSRCGQGTRVTFTLPLASALSRAAGRAG
ncbi:GAF domain-containing sensor histidine kinase [Thermogemmatispora sp.]|uniref:sensor histidine kinase n=1 Tax=Thermogemmatispora sp. TaxID=1968838 RepID=UPI001D2F80D4|nr:GAF domain-containing sensor histidine kinase [Thermogemmatispora sp.]MBX5451566.1 GAF domain-containing sensor histidine kinase [Thermogemmatispora sp.]